MNKKSLKPWVILSVAPIPTLFLVALLQVFVRFTNSGNPNALTTLVNIISLLLGFASVLALLGLPIWIIMLFVVSSRNSKVDESPPPTVEQQTPQV